jgi:DNA mismatch repair protein MSH4
VTPAADSQTYAKAIFSLRRYNPHIILLPQAMLNARANFASEPSDVSSSVTGRAAAHSPHGDAILVNCLTETFEDASLIPVVRKYWHAEDGLDKIKDLIVEDDSKVSHLSACQSRHYALSAAGALFSYLELKLHFICHAASLSIQYHVLEGTMLIDQETIDHLELLQNVAHSRSKASLFGLLSAGCSTAMGLRALRANILQPLTTPDTLDLRLDAVGELLENDSIYHACFKALKA